MNEYQMVPLSRLHESPWNVRRHFDDAKLQELADSIRRVGILTPLIARPNYDGYEIAAGHRRLRAAKLAGIPEAPVRILAMADAEFMEVLAIENLQREDLHPLDEALGYQALMEKAGYDVAAIAAKVAKSESYVYQRLKLAELIEPAKEAFLEDRITAGHAILIARLQPKDQEKALEACWQDQWGYPQEKADRQPCSVRDLSRWIQESIHLDLHTAPFSKISVDLLPAAGACTTCTKRTGFVPQLFPDVAKKDTCTDRSCFELKLQSHIAQKKAQLEAKGEKVLVVSTAYPEWSKKPKASDPITSDQYREVTRKDRCDSTKKAIVAAGHRDVGKVIEVCADPKCRKHHGTAYVRPQAEIDKQKAVDEKRRREAESRRRILDEILVQAPNALGRRDLELVACSFVREMQSEDAKAIVKRYNWPMAESKWGGQDWRETVKVNVPGLPLPELVGLLLELALIGEVTVPSWGDSGPTDLHATAERYDIDAAGIEKQVAAEFAEKKKAKAKKAGKPAKKAKLAPTGPAEG